jgi:hypothetical protein
LWIVILFPTDTPAAAAATAATPSPEYWTVSDEKKA